MDQSIRTRLDPEERKRQIIAAALEVFAEKGYLRATNKDIAEAAGVKSAGLIYHYFPSKGDLLKAIIEQHSRVPELLANSEKLMVKPPEIVLTLIGSAYLEFGTSAHGCRLIRLAAGEAARDSSFGVFLAGVGPGRVLGFLKEYMARKMAEGVLRPGCPALAARSFVGPFLTVVLTGAVLGMPLDTDPDMPHDAIVKSLVDSFLHGHSPAP